MHPLFDSIFYILKIERKNTLFCFAINKKFNKDSYLDNKKHRCDLLEQKYRKLKHTHHI